MKQGVYQVSEVQKYPIGLRFAKDDRVFKYCYAKEALNAMYGAFNKGEIHASGGAIAKHVQGSTLVNLDCATVVEKDELANGYLGDIYSHFIVGIKSNLATTAGIIAITLKDPLPVEIPVSDPAAIAANGGFECHHVRAYYNKYSHVVHWGGVEHENYMTVVCVPLIDVAADRYFWGQTWGDCIVRGEGCNIFSLIGGTSEKRQIAFCYRGGPVYATGENTDAFMQRMGSILFDPHPCSEAPAYVADSTPDGDNFVMLQLAP